LLKILLLKVKFKNVILELLLMFTMKKEMTVLFCLLCALLQSQTVVHLKDKELRIPIAYANIWKAKSLYKTADSTGVFSINSKETATYFKITAVGYHDTIAKITEEIFL
jgi:hypothetical protein